MEVSLRKVKEADLKAIYEWRNDKQIRRWLFASKPIKFREHKEFWSKRMKRKDAYSYIVKMNNNECGLIRLDPDQRAKGSYLIDICIDPEFHGKGIGSKVITEIKKVAKRLNLKRLIASVKPTNTASQRIFEKNKFKLRHYEYAFKL